MKHNKILYITGLIVALSFAIGCDDQFSPEDDYRMNKETVSSRPEYAEGLLDWAYVMAPYNSLRFDETATDDAVSNQNSNSFRKMTQGAWTALSNPQEQWGTCYKCIMNLNDFLSIIDDVAWKPSNPAQNEAFKVRLAGEAYALRGVMKYILLLNHAGIGTDGTLLGFPEFNALVSTLDEFKVPRLSFEESVESANNDFDDAIEKLPMDFLDLDEIPAKYKDLGLTLEQYNNTFGSLFTQRISGRIAMAFKSRLALLAASPLYNESGALPLWEEAANASAAVFKDLGGLKYFDPKGNLFWQKEQVEDSDLSLGDKKETNEILWRREMLLTCNWEQDNYAPTCYGHGRVNPTQNFIDAFPMLNGYPIDNPASGYDSQNPYVGRDLRMGQIVVYDLSMEWSRVIHILDGTTDDSVEETEYSTRTGYYLRKHLREDVSVQTSMESKQKHILPIVRSTEIYLNYAEAANEAWGPDGKGANGYSARDVIAAIRKRAGLNQPDAYLAGISSKEDMRKLIRNERRIELSFEGSRFWDIRRWKEDITEPAMGIRLDNGTYQTVIVEKRKYEPHMYFGPIPYNEVMKFGYIQNIGW